MESDLRFYSRRAAEEAAAATRALTAAARDRRLQLAELYSIKSRECSLRVTLEDAHRTLKAG